ncbi:MAG: hypothetical protein J7M11_01495, partial [Elusimicrobia bacterium]|nr:hypothetical protein [Elusimicrobiota bacterium]
MRNTGLYDKRFEHDSCGVGFVADIKGKASHQTVKDGITVLKNLVHRGALGGDLKTGDGAGMLLRIPHLFFCAEALKKGFSLPEKGHYGIAFIFMPRSKTARTKLEKSIRKIIKTESGRI